MKTTIIKTVFTSILMFLSLSAFAGPSVEFENTSHEFGTIKEADGLVSTLFNFTNTGNAPLIINAVKPSCGCTSPEWSREPILPGKTGFIKATYDPKNRPGKFEKSIAVSSNATNSPSILIIKGNVIPVGMVKPLN
jgi:hypothetical protein